MRVLLSSVWIWLLAFIFVASPYSAHATDSPTPAEAEGRIAELEEKVDLLTEEMGRLETIFAVPEALELESVYGLGPAASKIYLKDKGLSIGGYGEIRLRTFHDKNGANENEDDVFDALRAVLYVGYKFNDNWVLNSEFEFEHAGTGGGGSVSTEMLTIDYLWRQEANFRAGLLLVPMGFINEIHEPNFFFGAERPEVERLIIPTTWRENGVGIFGRIADRVEYRVYVINGLNACGTDRKCDAAAGAKGFSSGGLRGGRQKGSRALANDFAIVGRVDVDVAAGLLLGGSIYTGNSGQDQNGAMSGLNLPNARTTIYEVHAQYRGHGVSLRSLWTEAFVNQAGKLSLALSLGDDPALGGGSKSIANHMRGWYVEGAYDILPSILKETRMSLEPFVRYEQYDTQRDVNSRFARDKSKDIELVVAGLQFKPIPEVVFKVDYRHFNLAQGSRADEVQALVGYLF